MAEDNVVKLRVQVEGEFEKIDALNDKTDKTAAKFKTLATAAKDLDYQHRQGKLSAAELQASLSALKDRGDALNGTYRQNVDLSATLYQVEQRAAVGFKSLAVSVDQTTKSVESLHSTMRSKTLPAMTSFSQIIQDAPYGIRGVGNNIEFLTQQFTQLSAQGLGVKQILSGMMSNIMGPAGILLGVSLLTSALTILPDLFKKTGDEAGKAAKAGLKEYEDRIKSIVETSGVKGVESEISKVQSKLKEMTAQRESLYKTRTVQRIGADGLPVSVDETYLPESSKQQLNVLDANVKRLQDYLDKNKEALEIENERIKVLSIIGDQHKNGILPQLKQEIDALTDYRNTLDENQKAEIIATSKKIEAKQAEYDALTKISKTEKDNEKARKEARDREFADLKQSIAYREWMERTFETDGGLRAFDVMRPKDKDALWWDSSYLVGKNRDTITKGISSAMKPRSVRDVQQMPDESPAKILREYMETGEYSYLFTTLNAGFRSVGQTIQTEMHDKFVKAFGGANSMLQQFTVAVMDSIVSIGTKLAETAAMSGILSFLHIGDFTSNFMSLLGIGTSKHAEGGVITSPIYGIDMYGGRHIFGEDGREAVIPMSKLNQYGNESRFGSSNQSNKDIVKAINSLSLKFSVSSMRTSAELQGAERNRQKIRY